MLTSGIRGPAFTFDEIFDYDSSFVPENEIMFWLVLQNNNLIGVFGVIFRLMNTTTILRPECFPAL